MQSVSVGIACLLLAANPSTTPERGGMLRVAQRAEPRTFNPVIMFDAPSREVVRRMHEDLITIDRQTQKTVPALAESWTRSSDGKRYTLRLRKGVKFSDGVPFTADDVVFTWTVYLDPAVKSPQRDLLLIDGQQIAVRKKDDWTVEFTLPKPYAAAERLFDSLAMLPRHLLEQKWKNGTLKDAWGIQTAPAEMAGLGPFRLRQYLPGQSVVLERNPYYWRSGRPYLDGIEFRFLATEDLQAARFAAGDLDVLNRLNMKTVDFLKSRGTEVTDLGPGLEYNFLCFNLTPGKSKPWFESRAFRQALSLAVDRQAMVQVVYQGRGVPLWNFVSPGNRLWRAEQVSAKARSVDEARRLLAANGFRWGNDGRLLDVAGSKVEFTMAVSSSSQERQQMATLLQADFDVLGIRATPVPLEFRTLLERVTTQRQFDTVIQGLGGGDVDPNPEMNVWLSSGGMHLWNPGQKQPATDWEAEIDGLMTRQISELDPKARKKLYDRVQVILSEQAPMIFLVSPHIVVAQRGNVGNFRPAILNHFTLWNADELYLKQGGSGRR